MIKEIPAPVYLLFMETNPMMWRQGDIYFSTVNSIPTKAIPLTHCVLAEGEATGHSHRIEQAGIAELLEYEGSRFLRILGDSAVVMHQEHAPIVLPQGTYRVWRQREYTPRGIRRVVD
jgi:hypothetical protein